VCVWLLVVLLEGTACAVVAGRACWAGGWPVHVSNTVVEF
jgi:hypothetical protein